MSDESDSGFFQHLGSLSLSFIRLLGPGSFSPLIITRTRRKVEEMKGDEIQMNQSCHLFAVQLASVQWGGGGCSSVGSESLSYSCAPCCQAILRGLDANELWDRSREAGGKLTLAATSSKERERMSHRVVRVLLNKLMFGLILFPQKQRERDAKTILTAIIMQKMP